MHSTHILCSHCRLQSACMWRFLSHRQAFWSFSRFCKTLFLGRRKSSHGITEQGIGDKGKCRRMDALPHSQKRQQQRQQCRWEKGEYGNEGRRWSAIEGLSVCCCGVYRWLQQMLLYIRMTVSGVQKARIICNRRSWSSENLTSQNRWCASSQVRRGRRRKVKETRGTETMELTADLSWEKNGFDLPNNSLRHNKRKQRRRPPSSQEEEHWWDRENQKKGAKS